MNCGRCYEKQGKAAVTEAVWDGVFSCHLQCPLEEVPVIFLKVKVKYKKNHFDHFWTDSNNKTEWEMCDFGVGGMVGALHICATLWYDEGVFVSKTLLFSNWFKTKLMKMEKQYFRSCLDGVWRGGGGGGSKEKSSKRFGDYITLATCHQKLTSKIPIRWFYFSSSVINVAYKTGQMGGKAKHHRVTMHSRSTHPSSR